MCQAGAIWAEMTSLAGRFPSGRLDRRLQRQLGRVCSIGQSTRKFAGQRFELRVARTPNRPAPALRRAAGRRATQIGNAWVALRRDEWVSLRQTRGRPGRSTAILSSFAHNGQSRLALRSIWGDAADPTPFWCLCDAHGQLCLPCRRPRNGAISRASRAMPVSSRLSIAEAN